MYLLSIGIIDARSTNAFSNSHHTYIQYARVYIIITTQCETISNGEALINASVDLAENISENKQLIILNCKRK